MNKRAALLLSMVLSLVLAQPGAGPELSLNRFSLGQGERLELSAGGLAVDAAYELVLTSPDGDERSGALRSDALGELEFNEVLREPGNWTLELTGEDVDTLFRIEVMSDEAAPTEDVSLEAADAGADDAGAFAPGAAAELDAPADAEENAEDAADTEEAVVPGDPSAEDDSQAGEDVSEGPRPTVGVTASAAEFSTEPGAASQFRTEPEANTLSNSNAAELDVEDTPALDAVDEVDTGSSGDSVESSVDPTDPLNEDEPDVYGAVADELSADESSADESSAEDSDDLVETPDTNAPDSEGADSTDSIRSVEDGGSADEASAPASDIAEAQPAQPVETEMPPVGDAAATQPVAGTRSLATGLERIFASVARVGWYSVAALLVAILALHITLLFKYWLPQSVILRRSADGQTSPVWARLLVIRYYSITEKLVLVILFVFALFLAGLAGWNSPSRPYSSWQEAVQNTFSNPWTGLQLDRPASINVYVWTLLIALFLAWALFTLFWLFVPRPRLARRAPRSLLYHVFALLVPGSGLADEVWGLLLITPWALAGLDTLSDFFGWGLGIPVLHLRGDYALLILIYLINTVAVVLELLAYRRDMIQLKETSPELAEEFGLTFPAQEATSSAP